jgi:hypothetical protein
VFRCACMISAPSRGKMKSSAGRNAANASCEGAGISCLRQIACPNSVQPRPQYEHCLGELRPNARTTMCSDSVGGTHMAFELVAERESETAPGLVLSNHENLFRE